ncbi:MAG: hypothetical protein R3C20_03440 [Planctomycetaceae bacterium]
MTQFQQYDEALVDLNKALEIESNSIFRDQQLVARLHLQQYGEVQDGVLFNYPGW